MANLVIEAEANTTTTRQDHGDPLATRRNMLETDPTRGRRIVHPRPSPRRALLTALLAGAALTAGCGKDAGSGASTTATDPADSAWAVTVPHVTAQTVISVSCTPQQATACFEDNPCRIDHCNTGVCSHVNVANGTSCGSGVVCNAGACRASCYIGSAFYGTGAVNPANPCLVCAPDTSTVAWSPRAAGTACNDGNACTLGDTCQAGVCTGGSPVVCTASDQCHTAGTCNTATGACSNPARPNNVACNDGNACTLGDTCQAGVCAAGAPACTTPPDACHLAMGATCDPGTGACTYAAKACPAPQNPCQQTAGVCDLGTGQCAYPDKLNGTSCDDGNAFTQHDACWGGVCAGVVVCPGQDACHTSTYDATTGTCTLTAMPEGAPCANCTAGATCHAGACTGGGATTCTAAPDDCHTTVGATCDLLTGCVYPRKSDGAPCGDRCTVNASCQAGTCTGGAPLPCALPATTPPTSCLLAYCDPGVGCVSGLYRPPGTPCDDGNPNTVDDICGIAGFCAGTSRAGNAQCQGVPDGAGCDDGNPCTVHATCTGGVCARVGGAYRQDNQPCDPHDPCIRGAVCVAGGVCQGTPAPDGAPCDDGNACTTGESCHGGACQGGAAVSCSPVDACHTSGACDPLAGCPVQPEGTPCSSGSTCLGSAACDGRGLCVDSPADFVPMPKFSRTAPGPYSGHSGSWRYLSDYAGLARGADWTEALKQAVTDVVASLPGPHPTPVLYVPSGAYELSDTVVVRGAAGMKIVGQDPATTTFRWTGAGDADMFLFDSNYSLVMSRLTLDGQHKARIAVHEDQVYCYTLGGSTVCWPPSGVSVYQSEYSDLRITGFEYGIVGGDWTVGDRTPTGVDPPIVFTPYAPIPLAGDRGSNNADVVIRRCTFSEISEQAVSVAGANAIAWQIWDSRFTGVHHAVQCDGDADFGVYNSYFDGAPSPPSLHPGVLTRGADSSIVVRQSSWYELRGNVARSGGWFLDGAGNNTSALVIGNHIEAFDVAPGANNAAMTFGGMLGHLTIVDNVIGTRPDVAAIQAQARLTTGGNTFTGRPSGSLLEIAPYTVTEDVLSFGDTFDAFLGQAPFLPRIPTAPPVPQTSVLDLCLDGVIPPGQTFGQPGRAVIELCDNATSAGVQAVLDRLAATSTAGAVIHLRAGSYAGLGATIVVPGGLDVTIAGDGARTLLAPHGAGGAYSNYLFDLQAPARAAIRDLVIYPNPGATGALTSGIRVQTTDAAGDLVYAEQLYIGDADTMIELAGVDHAAMRIEQTDGGGLHWARVLGGGAAAADRSATQGLRVFGGAAAGYVTTVDLANHGKALVEEVDFEQTTQGAVFDDGGYLTQAGGRSTSTSPWCGQNQQFKQALPNAPDFFGAPAMRGSASFVGLWFNAGLFFDAATSADVLILGATNDTAPGTASCPLAPLQPPPPQQQPPQPPPAPPGTPSPFECTGATPTSSALPGQWVSLATTPTTGKQHMLLQSTVWPGSMPCNEKGFGGACDPSTATCDATTKGAFIQRMLADLRGPSVTPRAQCGATDVRLSRLSMQGSLWAKRPMPTGVRLEKKPDGAVRWADSFAASAGVGAATALAVDAGGDALVAGTAGGTIALGSCATDASPCVTLPAGPYLAKLDSQGHALWAHPVSATVVTTDEVGNVYVGAGATAASYGADGTLRWSVDLGATSVDAVIYRPTTRTVAFGGAFSGTLHVGAGALGPSTASDGYVVELSGSHGDYVAGTWITDATGSGDQIVRALAVDRAGSLFAGGSTTGTLASGPAGSRTSYALGGATEFVVQLGTGWGMGLVATRRLVALAVDWRGDVVLAGIAGGTFDLGGVHLVGHGTSDDVLVAKLSNTLSGDGVTAARPYQVAWAQLLGSAADDTAGGVAVDPMGNVVVSGTQGSAPFLVKLDGAGNPVVTAPALWHGVFGGSAHAVHVAVSPTTFDVYLLLDNDAAVDLGVGPMPAGTSGNQLLARFRP